MNSRMRREENRAPMRIEMQELRRVVHTRSSNLQKSPGSAQNTWLPWSKERKPERR